MIRIGFICPVFRAAAFHSYTTVALRSFFDTTPGGVAIVADDGSKEWNKYQQLYEQLPRSKEQQIHFIHFNDQVGLTRSWNAGLTLADELKLDYAIAGNNDVIFTNNWYSGLLHALNNGYALAGPLSNAPGVTAKNGQQKIQKHLPSFELTDDRDKLDTMSAELHRDHLGEVFESRINGFFQIASMDSWRKGMFNIKDYYRPRNVYDSKGRRNLTPTLTLNEDELQGRWGRLGMKSVIVLSSFIFHYRAVSRGGKYKCGAWYRQK